MVVPKMFVQNNIKFKLEIVSLSYSVVGGWGGGGFEGVLSVYLQKIYFLEEAKILLLTLIISKEILCISAFHCLI